MLIKLKVHADSRERRVERRAADSYEIWVKARPREGAANREALAALAAALGARSGDLRLVKGATSPAKIVELRER